MPGFGAAILRLALVVFAYTTVLGWSFYGEKCWEFLLGTRALLPFRLAWGAVTPFGAIAQLDFAWLVADTFNGLMAIPTLIALLLNPALRLNRDYFAEQRGAVYRLSDLMRSSCGVQAAAVGLAAGNDIVQLRVSWSFDR